MKGLELGISGHQEFPNKQWVDDALKEELINLQPRHGYSSLAVGADQLFAEAMIQEGVPYTAVIPCDNYESTFKNASDLNRYNQLLLNAASRLMLDFTEPSEQAFFDAGIEVVERSDILLVVWNGKPAKGKGGTGDMVNYAQSIGRSIIHLNPVTMERSYYGKQ